MKKCCLVLLLLGAGFSLGAQSNSNVFVFFPSIIGTSRNVGDNAAIVSMLTNELTKRNCVLISSPQKADFLLYGTLTPLSGTGYEGRYFADTSATVVYSFDTSTQDATEQLFHFQLTLKNVKTNETVQQNLIYASIDDINNFFPLMTYNLFSHIFGSPLVDAWLNKRLYAGVSAFWSPRIYYGTQQSAHFVNFGGGALMELLLAKFMSLEAGVELIPDWVVHSAGHNYQNLMLEIPVALRFIFKLSDYYMLGPYGGIHVNVPLYDTTKTPLFAWMAGIVGGVKAGPGIFFVEPRFSMDIGKSSLNTEPDITPLDYQRFIVHIGIGYKFGIFTMR
jgi:hypothetical protein